MLAQVHTATLDPQLPYSPSFQLSWRKCNFSILQDRVKVSHLGDVYIIKNKIKI